MLVGLLSDSHGRSARTREAIRLLTDRGATMFLHMGDVETEEVVDQLAGLDARLVFGNNDDERSLGPYAASLGIIVMHPMGRITVDGRTIAFTHGHLGRCVVEGSDGSADYFIHGHTHRSRDERRGTTRFINPGALHRASPFSVALLDPANDSLEFVVVPH